MVTAVIEVKVVEGDFNALFTLAQQFVVAGDVVWVHAGIGGRQKDALPHLLTADGLTAQIFIRLTHHILRGIDEFVFTAEASQCLLGVSIEADDEDVTHGDEHMRPLVRVTSTIPAVQMDIQEIVLFQRLDIGEDVHIVVHTPGRYTLDVELEKAHLYTLVDISLEAKDVMMIVGVVVRVIFGGKSTFLVVLRTNVDWLVTIYRSEHEGGVKIADGNDQDDT